MNINQIQSQLERISHLVNPADYSPEICVCCNGSEIYSPTSKVGYICDGCDEEIQEQEFKHKDLMDSLPSW